MPAPHISTAQSTEHARRRRQATACTTCRNRRVRQVLHFIYPRLTVLQVKCDRARPACLRCTTGGRSCEYITAPTATIEFLEPLVQGPSTPPVTSSETWKSVIEQQVALVDQSKLGRGLAKDIPFWALAESGEGPVSVESRGALVCRKNPL